MKILYSQIKNLVPKLKAGPKEIGEILTMTGLMMDKFTEVVCGGKKDYLLSLEVRQNRPDCLSTIGIAKEIAAYYGLSVKIPAIPRITFGKKSADIKVKDKKHVKRIVAVEIGDIKNSESPNWLKEFLYFYGMSSNNLLVDLSNYVMLVTGQPSHVFDRDKVQGTLSWSMNDKFEKINTLDKEEVKINGNTLIVSDDINVLALAGVIGGDHARIKMTTKSIIAEMAIYDGSMINKNSRSLNIVTEASVRLNKNLDPNNLDFAMQYLISLILKYCGGKIESKLFNYYPKKYTPKAILFDPLKPSIFAGVKIEKSKAEKILKNLGCKIKKSGKNKLSVTPPINRTDLEIEEDLIEEVIRIFGFYNIPSGEIPALEVVKKITPTIIDLSDRAKNILSASGFDEILSLPLVAKSMNLDTKYKNLDTVMTQNSINEEYPELRQSLAAGLILQLKNYTRLGIEDSKMFEIGKVFGKKNNKYLENESLGVLISSKQNISEIKNTVENLLRSLGAGDIKYIGAESKPAIANPFSVFNIIVKKRAIGILYKLTTQVDNNVYFSEIDLDELCTILEKAHYQSTFEITHKIIDLDNNIELDREESVYDFLESVKQKIGERNIMAIKIVDVFPLNSKTRYTIRVSYKGLSDTEAKKLHSNAFNIKQDIN